MAQNFSARAEEHLTAAGIPAQHSERKRSYDAQVAGVAGGPSGLFMADRRGRHFLSGIRCQQIQINHIPGVGLRPRNYAS